MVDLVPARMKKTQSKKKALEGSQHYPSIFKMLKGSLLHNKDETLTKFKHIQALIVVLLVCKKEEDPFKIESTRVVTKFLLL